MTTWDYAYDPRGRLSGVLRDGEAVEEYAYDRAGRRVLARTEATGGVAEGYTYDGDLLLRAGEESFAHAGDGTLAICRGATGRTLFDYEPEGGRGRVELPDGRMVAYLTSDLGQLLEKFVDGRRTERFRWRDPLRLSAYRDLERGVSMRFHYGPERLPRTVTVSDARGERTLYLGYDQVGTLKAVADDHGHLIQAMEYDSIGNPLHVSAPFLLIPLGFGGGLRDRHTGLVRLVRRDYDPRVGRFTAPDPLGDTGGDHDLFEYCVDDPVNTVDPTGELAFSLPLMFLAGVAASKVPDLAVAGALAAPEAVPAAARGAAAAKDLAGTAATKFAQAAAKAETAVNNATVNAMGKAAEVAGKISPKVGEAVMNPAVYKAANDALSSYAPTGAPEPSYYGAGGGAAGMKDELLGVIKTATDKLGLPQNRTHKLSTKRP